MSQQNRTCAQRDGFTLYMPKYAFQEQRNKGDIMHTGAEINSTGGEIIFKTFGGLRSVAMPETALFLQLSYLID